MELVQSAFLKKVYNFTKKKKELKEMKPRRKKLNCELPSPGGVQLSIKEFYCSSNVLSNMKHQDDEVKNSVKFRGSSESERRKQSPNFSKSARHKLLLCKFFFFLSCMIIKALPCLTPVYM